MPGADGGVDCLVDGVACRRLRASEFVETIRKENENYARREYVTAISIHARIIEENSPFYCEKDREYVVVSFGDSVASIDWANYS